MQIASLIWEMPGKVDSPTVTSLRGINGRIWERMMRKSSVILIGGFFLAALWAGALRASGQTGNDNQHIVAVSIADPSSSSAAAIQPAGNTNQQTSIRPFSTLGISGNMSLLGVGVQAATPLSMRTNLRVGFNTLGFSQTFVSDGINYAGTLTLRSFDTLLDWYPFKGSFHVSPGAMLYNGNQIKANASVAGGAFFTLNSAGYLSSVATPVTGNGQLKFNPVAPMVLAGWGNVVPRTKRFSIPFEVGTVFQGSPQTSLNLNGDVCNLNGTNCRAISSDKTVLANIQAQQTKLSNDVSAFKYYPVMSVGFAYRFGFFGR
jgi:hypothetical protein